MCIVRKNYCIIVLVLLLFILILNNNNFINKNFTNSIVKLIEKKWLCGKITLIMFAFDHVKEIKGKLG